LSDARAALILIPPVGGPERKVAETRTIAEMCSCYRYVAWSPDSKHLAFMDKTTAA